MFSKSPIPFRYRTFIVLSPSDKNVRKNSELVNPRKQHRKKQKLLSFFACRNIFVCFNSYYFLNWHELIVLPCFQIWVLMQWMFLVNSRYICHLKTAVNFILLVCLNVKKCILFSSSLFDCQDSNQWKYVWWKKKMNFHWR